MKDLTCCIAFRNEGDEVESTIKSIISTAPDVHILVVDDCSDDGINYKNMLCKYLYVFKTNRPQGTLKCI